MASLPSAPLAGVDTSVERRACLRNLLGLGALGLTGCATRQQGPAASTESVPPFSVSPMGSTQPTGWEPYVIRRDKVPTQYTIVPGHDRPVLHARSNAAASGMRCVVRIDPHRAAHLRFSWRVQQVPSQASIETPESDDSPARLILAFEGDHAKLSLRDRLMFDQVELFTGHKVPYATLMYVWDSSVRPETVVHNHRTSRVRYLTVDSRAGHWLHYERDVVADFRRAFGEAPGLITSVGVLTDSDATKHDFHAWYGDISLNRRRRS